MALNNLAMQWENGSEFCEGLAILLIFCCSGGTLLKGGNGVVVEWGEMCGRASVPMGVLLEVSILLSFCALSCPGVSSQGFSMTTRRSAGIFGIGRLTKNMNALTAAFHQNIVGC